MLSLNLADFLYFMCCVAGDQPLLEPLLFPVSQPESSHNDTLHPEPVECLLCDKVFLDDRKSDYISEHLISSHNLVIDGLQRITDLSK